MVVPRILIVLLVLFTFEPLALVWGRGRHPDDRNDQYPDYNRLEMHPRPRTPVAAPAENTPLPSPPPARPALNAPAGLPSDVDAAPKPPPKPVPVAEEDGEPPMPDEILRTLNAGAAGQSPSLSTATAPTSNNP